MTAPVPDRTLAATTRPTEAEALAAHQEYRAAGFRPIPCRLKKVYRRGVPKKQPLFPGGSWKAAEKYDLRKAVREGYRDVALLCDDIVALDFDQRPGEDLSAVWARCQAAQELYGLIGAICERSGRGYHLICRAPPGTWTRRIWGAPHLVEEVRCGEDCLIFVTPSWHPIEECRYGRFPPFVPLADLPLCPIELLEQPAPEPVTRPAPAPRPVMGTTERAGDWKSLDVVALFDAEGLYLAAIGAGKHGVRCPWESEHTAGSDGTDTVIFEARNGNGPGFKCLHAHCAGRRIRAVREFFGPDAVDRFCTQRFRPDSSFARALRPMNQRAFSADPTVSRAEVGGIVASIARSDERDTARVVCLSDVEPESIRWLWPGWIPLGKLTVLEGDPGLGKSTLALALAAAVSTGRALPGAATSTPAAVVIVTFEDGLADTIRPRLDAAGADVSRVHAIQGIAPPDGLERLVCLPDDAPAVFEIVARLGAKLLIIDPLTAALSGETDSHRDSDIRRALAPLARYAEESGVAVVVIRHLRKSAGRAISSGGGSVAIGAAARAVLAVHEDPDHPEDTGARVLCVVKANLAERPPSLLWRLASEPGEAAHVVWGGASPHTADKLAALRGESEGGQDSEREIDEWLRSDLEDGPQERREVLRRATAAGFSSRTLDRAAARVGVVRRQSGYGSEKHSEWSLPSIQPQSRQSSPIENTGAIGAIEQDEDCCPDCDRPGSRPHGCPVCAELAAR